MWTLSIFSLFIITYFIIMPTEACENPVITSNLFVTEDSTHLTNTAYIVVFEVKCDSEKLVQNLYSAINGNISPVCIVDKNKFQVSWVEDLKISLPSQKVIRIYDEKDVPAIRRHLHSNEGKSSVPTLGTIIFNHGGAYSGPYLQWEILTVIISSIAAYYAVASKLDILA